MSSLPKSREGILLDAVGQLIACKEELYKLRGFIVQILPYEHREEAARQYEQIYNALDKLQDFIRSR